MRTELTILTVTLLNLINGCTHAIPGFQNFDSDSGFFIGYVSQCGWQDIVQSNAYQEAQLDRQLELLPPIRA